MEDSKLYALLMRASVGGACDGFDAHVFASAVSLAAIGGNRDGAALVNGLGLRKDEILAVFAELFPSVVAGFSEVIPGDVVPELRDDEACLRDLLRRSASNLRLGGALAAIVARRALEPNHLWQDLGLRNRRELSWLMERHFERLSARNTADMKWKKFLYRAICRDEGFGICVAPTCGECSDYEKCFGEEKGERLLGSELSASSAT